MNSCANTWQQSLSALGATFDPDNTDVQHFGDPTAELAAAAQGTILVPLLHFSCIEASGSDAKAFLQAQLTNDLNSLQAGQAQLSAWCSAKGRMLASLVNYPLGENYRLMLATDLLPAILQRLRMFVLRSRVTLADLSQTLGHLGLAGTGVEAALAAAGLPTPEMPMTTATQDQVSIIRLSPARVILAAPLTELSALWQKLATLATPAGRPAWQYRDVQEAFPWITGATREEFVPQMADFEKMGGVSFHKGCYPGQEVVARTQYLGKVKRHLYRLKSPVPLSPGEELHAPASPDQSAGKVITCAPSPDRGFVALAVVLAPAAGDLHQGSMSGPRLQAEAVNP
ncbi:MAG: folate-binding protein [Azovibrio sp.]|uniref:CAF17-like 4Fe-4S cluster assembly/insertion protein YgfZ n=1 Tax=Azovibrio sp. TaxID=1872673 RepID=UPI003C749534